MQQRTIGALAYEFLNMNKLAQVLLSGALILSLILSLTLSSASIAIAATPSVSYTTNATTPFSILTIAGNGFSPNEPVALSLGLSSAAVVADGAGTFSGAQLSIPSVPSGLYYLIAVGQTSGAVAFSSLYVNSFFPNVSPSSWYLSPGMMLSWSGSGFAPGEGILIRDAYASTIASFSANGSGAFSAAGGTVIPLNARNSTVQYTVQGNLTGLSVLVPITVSDLFPSVMPSMWYALPGTPISFNGSGFGAGEMVHVYLGSGTTAIAHATADSSGAFTVSGLTLPFGSAIAQYRFMGEMSGVTASAPVTLASYYPSLAPSAYYAAPGSQITVSGSGFAATEPVTLSLGIVPVATITTDITGGFSPVSVSVPSTPNSTVAFHALGGLSGASAELMVTIGQYYPNIVPTDWFTYPGNSITFSGSGFAPNESIAMAGPMSGTVIADASGAFSGLQATIPVSASGVANFVFTGAQSSAEQTIGIALGVRNAAIWFDQYYAQGGTAFTVFGAGFGTSEPVVLSAGGIQFGTGTADASGNVAVLASIPYAPAGTLSISALGSATGASAEASLTVAPVYTSLELASYVVTAGNTLTFIGHGYLPNEPIRITTDRTGSTVVAEFTTDSSGNFTNSSFIIPAEWASGLLNVRAHGVHSYSDTDIVLWVNGI